ncbi:MAG: hypothetical protein WCJ37_14050 [Syntrophus sp. (in: bacteria)]
MEKERIKDLEEKERTLMVRSIEGAKIEGAKARAVSRGIHRELEEVRAELKRLRRIVTIKSREASAGKKYLDSTVAVSVNRVTRDKIEALAASKAMTISEYMRLIIEGHIAAQVIDFSGGLIPPENEGKVEKDRQ